MLLRSGWRTLELAQIPSNMYKLDSSAVRAVFARSKCLLNVSSIFSVYSFEKRPLRVLKYRYARELNLRPREFHIGLEVTEHLPFELQTQDQFILLLQI
jgi:hypothetical protein